MNNSKVMTQGGIEKDKSIMKPLTLYTANCIICNAEFKQTTKPSENNAICYRCYEKMWGKHYSQIELSLNKAA